jgi:hypothetical protein
MGMRPETRQAVLCNIYAIGVFCKGNFIFLL